MLPSPLSPVLCTGRGAGSAENLHRFLAVGKNWSVNWWVSAIPHDYQLAAQGVPFRIMFLSPKRLHRRDWGTPHPPSPPRGSMSITFVLAFEAWRTADNTITVGRTAGKRQGSSA